MRQNASSRFKHWWYLVSDVEKQSWLNFIGIKQWLRCHMSGTSYHLNNYCLTFWWHEWSVMFVGDLYYIHHYGFWCPILYKPIMLVSDLCYIRQLWLLGLNRDDTMCLIPASLSAREFYQQNASHQKECSYNKFAAADLFRWSEIIFNYIKWSIHISIVCSQAMVDDPCLRMHAGDGMEGGEGRKGGGGGGRGKGMMGGGRMFWYYFDLLTTLSPTSC